MPSKLSNRGLGIRYTFKWPTLKHPIQASIIQGLWGDAGRDRVTERQQVHESAP